MARGGRPFEGFCRCAEVHVIPRTMVSQPRIIVGGSLPAFVCPGTSFKGDGRGSAIFRILKLYCTGMGCMMKTIKVCRSAI